MGYRFNGCGDSWTPPTGQRGMTASPSSLAALVSNPWAWGIGAAVLLMMLSGGESRRRQ